MKTDSALSRRTFLSTLAAAGAAAAIGSSPTAQAAGGKTGRNKIIAFSKPFQDLSPDDTADFVADVGWDGIECPVRAGGQILPERVEEDLPKMVEALKKRNLELTVVTTDIKNPSQPLTQKILHTAKRLGITQYRVAFWTYDAKTPIPKQLDEIRAELRDLTALNKELGMQAGFQNHSGGTRVGAAGWDVYELVKDLDPKYTGVFFDIGHAAIEGGLSWPTQARLLRPYYMGVYAQDALWNKTATGWKNEWCPLGQGIVSRSFFTNLMKTGYTGMFSQKHEYKWNSRAEMKTAMKKDLAVFREWLAV